MAAEESGVKKKKWINSSFHVMLDITLLLTDDAIQRIEEEEWRMEKKTRKMRSIKAKLLATILPVAAVMVLAIAATSYLISKNIITEYSQNLLRSSIANQANEIESWLNENLSAFQTVKRAIEGTKPSEEELQRILDSYYQFNDNYPEGVCGGCRRKADEGFGVGQDRQQSAAVRVVPGRHDTTEYGVYRCIYG